MAFKMMGGKDPKSKTGNGVPSSLMGGPKMKSCGGPMMHEGKAHDPVDTKKAKAKPKKDPKKNAINAQFDYVQKKFPNKIVQRDRQKFGSYRISSKEPSGASFGYTPGNQVTKLSSEPKESKKKGGPMMHKGKAHDPVDAVKKDNTPENQARVKARKDKEKVELGKKKAKSRLDQEEGKARVKSRKDKKKAGLEKEKADSRKEQTLGMAKVKARKDKEKMELKKKKANFRKEQEEGMARVAARKAKKANN